jgi:sugar phosphate isomerase/epimerase
MKKLQIGIVSDEIAGNFAEAMRYAALWNIALVELRVLTSGRVPDVSREDTDEVRSYIDKGACRVTALSPGLFKHPLSRREALEAELGDALPRTMDMAAYLGSPLIIVFGFKREEGEPESHFRLAVEYLRRAASLVAGRGMKLAVENEPGFWCDTGVNTRTIIDAVASDAFGANWDPCNAFGTTEAPYPDGYRALKERIFNVHAKDTRENSLVECVPIGEGKIDWEGQMRALMSDGIVSHVTIETHCLPLIENSRRNVETLRRMMDHGGRA